MEVIQATNMIYIGRYEELNPGKGYPSMKDFMEPEKYPYQDTISSYLRNAESLLVSTGNSPKDVFTGDWIHVEPMANTDGVYAWPIELFYYVRKYNLRLPEKFERHILKHYNIAN